MVLLPLFNHYENIYKQYTNWSIKELFFFFILILFHIGEKAFFETSGNVAHKFGQDVRSFYGGESAVHVDAFERPEAGDGHPSAVLSPFSILVAHDNAGRVFCHSTNSSSSTGPANTVLYFSVFTNK